MNLQEAHMIADSTDADAMRVAIQDYIACSGASGPSATLTAQNIVSAAAESVLNLAETEEQTTYQSLLALIRRMSVLPGQRVIVMCRRDFLCFRRCFSREGR